MISPKRGRGRPKKKVPFFSDPVAEQKRLTGGYQPRRSTRFTEAFIDELSAGGEEVRQELLKDTGPYVSLELVLRLNMSDLRGYPVDSPQAAAEFDDALAKRREAAVKGGEARPKYSLAAEIVASDADYIRTKRAEGFSTNRIIMAIAVRRAKNGQRRAGRTQMYEQIRKQVL